MPDGLVTRLATSKLLAQQRRERLTGEHLAQVGLLADRLELDQQLVAALAQAAVGVRPRARSARGPGTVTSAGSSASSVVVASDEQPTSDDEHATTSATSGAPTTSTSCAHRGADP